MEKIEGLDDLLNGAWRLTDDGRAIARGYRFRDFPRAFGFMSAVALTAERMDHHPDWSNSHDRVEVRLTTHSAGGLTTKDVSLAKAMDALAEDMR